MEKVTGPLRLNHLDQHTIFEHLLDNAGLPPVTDWAKEEFALNEGKPQKLDEHNRLPGDPPHPAGLALKTLALLEVPEFDDLLRSARETHLRNGHPTVGILTRELAYSYWHPELILAAQQAVAECPQCQLMQRPDPTLPDLSPITPPPPLTRWAIDFTSFAGRHILVAVEYATGWLEVDLTPNETFAATMPLLSRIKSRFGAPREWISDNAGCFAGNDAGTYHQRHGSRLLPVTPSRPRGNGKVEKANGMIKQIMNREHTINPHSNIQRLLVRAVNILNRTIRPSGYSAFFLLYGTQPPQLREPSAQFTVYSRDPTEEEEAAFERSLARHHEAPAARQRANGLTASKDAVRAMLQEKKALLRVYGVGDWVLRVRQRGHKHEPFYDGPWAIAGCFAGNTYALRSPGGITLPSKYNGTNLFPAYSVDGHPIRSLWYASKTMLERDRKRLAAQVDL